MIERGVEQPIEIGRAAVAAAAVVVDGAEM